MVRTELQLDDAVYERIKQRAVADRRSTSEVILEALDAYLEAPKPRNLKLSDFTFIGAGRSDGKGPHPLSVRHDEALAEVRDA